MSVQVRQSNGDGSIELVEVEFKHGQLRVEELTHLIFLNDLLHHRECHCLVPEYEVQEPGDEVHSLAVVQVWVYYCIGLQDLVQVLRLYLFEIIE